MQVEGMVDGVVGVHSLISRILIRCPTLNCQSINGVSMPVLRSRNLQCMLAVVVSRLTSTSGRVEHEEFINQTPDRTYQLAAVRVSNEPAKPTRAAAEFHKRRTAPELEAERQQLDRWLAATPDKTLAMVAQLHPALGAAARLVAGDLRMHRAGVTDRPCGLSHGYGVSHLADFSSVEHPPTPNERSANVAGSNRHRHVHGLSLAAWVGPAPVRQS
jgi:hypothetical protein